MIILFNSNFETTSIYKDIKFINFGFIIIGSLFKIVDLNVKFNVEILAILAKWDFVWICLGMLQNLCNCKDYQWDPI
jgi:hypothetical protein